MNTIFNSKSNNNKNDLLFTAHPILFIFFYIILLTITLLYIPEISGAKNTNEPAPKFQNKYNTIYVGKSYKYIILNKPQNSSVRFSINNKKLAKLNSNTGLLLAKKKGTVKLKAEIKNKNKSIILTKHITIKYKTNKINKKSNSELFSPPSHVNNINFTVKLKCARIMQQSQVENSSISLSKDNSLANGNFKSLSDDGRYITYELNNSSIKLLSPGDRSMDGTYRLSCTLSKETYNINYYEHMLGQAVTGFVFDRNRHALENADITLTDNNITVSAKTDKNGYYMIRFPKATNVTMSVSYKNYFSKYCDNISLKVTKAICKNIILHNENSKNLALSFNIAGNDNSAKKIEISTYYTAFNTPDDQTALKTFFTDSLGNLLLTDSEQSSLSSQTDADIITISDNQKFLSHTDNADISGNIKKDIFNFSYNQNYYVKVYSENNNTYTLKSEFCFSFNDFTSKYLVFNITPPSTEKTNYTKALLPINVGSNVDYNKINYCNVRLYRIGINLPLCTFNFSENTLADFKNQIDKMNLYLNDGNIYYAIFQLYNYESKELLSPVLHRFRINNSKIYFENDTITFNDSFNADTKLLTLPSYKNTITNVSLLPEDTTCLNTVFCSYNSYGDIKKTVLTSLSSQLMQQELLKSSTPCIVYTNNSEFGINSDN